MIDNIKTFSCNGQLKCDCGETNFNIIANGEGGIYIVAGACVSCGKIYMFKIPSLSVIKAKSRLIKVIDEIKKQSIVEDVEKVLGGRE